MQLKLVFATSTANLWITHSNTSPNVTETDTITAHVSWNEMQDYNGYSVSLIFTSASYELINVIDEYDSPLIVYQNYLYIYKWFHGYISDNGEDDRHWIKVRYIDSGDFSVTEEFGVYHHYCALGYCFWHEDRIWYTSINWNINKNLMQSATIKHEITVVNVSTRFTIIDSVNAIKYAMHKTVVKEFYRSYTNISIWVSFDFSLQHLIVTFRDEKSLNSTSIVLDYALVMSLRTVNVNIY